MQLKKIAAMIRAANHCVIIDAPDENGEVRQFIGDGSAVYELPIFSEISTEMCVLIFDIPEKERAGFGLSVISTLPPSLRDIDRSDTEATATFMTLTYKGKDYMPICARDRIVFIDPDALGPLKDEVKKGTLGLYLRDGFEGVIVKDGVVKTIAAIASTPLTDKAFETLGLINRMELARRMEDGGREDAAEPAAE